MGHESAVVMSEQGSQYTAPVGSAERCHSFLSRINAPRVTVT